MPVMSQQLPIVGYPLPLKIPEFLFVSKVSKIVRG